MSHPGKKDVTGKLGFWMSTSLAVGNMTGSGIFLLPAALAVYGGISIFGWLYTVAGAVFLALMFSRLSRIITRAGGPYAYVRAGFGEFPGFIVAWGYWVSIWAGNAAIAVAGVGYLSVFMPALKENRLLAAIIAILAIWVFTFINTRSIRKVGMTQLITTIIKIIPLVVLGSLGFIYFDRTHFQPMNLSGQPDFTAITATAALTLWAFLGLESATIPSDKVKRPAKTIPRATIAGILITSLLYISGTLAVMGIISPAELQDSSSPFADAAGRIWGDPASVLVAACASIACFGALNGWILLQGQIPLAAAEDNLFPSWFKKTSGKGVPVTGLVIASVLATILVGINFSRGLVKMFSFIIMLSTLSCLLPYLLSSLSEIALKIKNKHAVKTRSLITGAIISIPSFAYSTWAITGLEYEVLIWGVILLSTGIPVFVILKARNRGHE